MSGKNHDHVTQSLFIRFLVDPRVPLSLAEFRIVQNVALIFFFNYSSNGGYWFISLVCIRVLPSVILFSCVLFYIDRWAVTLSTILFFY